MNICKNCQNEFEGSFCNACGEKVIHEKDFRINNIISQAFGTLTNFDSKIFQTLKLLFFFPGKLTIKFVEGIRVPYMKPFQLFVISNIVFFIFLSELDLFRNPSQWYFSEYFDGVRVMDKVRSISEKKGLEISEIAVAYDKRSSSLAKGLIIILIPFIGIMGYLLNIKRGIAFGKHIIFATHFFSFFLFYLVIISGINFLLYDNFNKWFFVIPTILIIPVYYAIGFKTFYRSSWLAALWKGILAVFLILILTQFYRIGINFLSLYTL